MRAAVLTVSDSAAAGTREDISGPALCARLNTTALRVVPDEVPQIQAALIEWADSGDFDIIVTTGGTGIATRDVTPEATKGVLDREVPGLAEWMRFQGMQKTSRAILSRGLAGIRKKCVIINVPGSPKGAVESIDTVAPLIPHMIDLLRGNTEHGNSR